MGRFGNNDGFLIYSDGLLDARPDLNLGRAELAVRLAGAATAEEMVARLLALCEPEGPPPDDLTVMVLRRRAEGQAGNAG